MTKELGDLIQIVIKKDFSGCASCEYKTTGQIIDSKDLTILKIPPTNIVNGKLPKEVYPPLPKETNALLLGKEYHKAGNRIVAASYCVLIKRPDNGVRRFRS